MRNYCTIQTSEVNPKIQIHWILFDPDPEFWSNLDTEPDPGLCYQFWKKKEKIIKKRRHRKKFFLWVESLNGEFTSQSYTFCLIFILYNLPVWIQLESGSTTLIQTHFLNFWAYQIYNKLILIISNITNNTLSHVLIGWDEVWSHLTARNILYIPVYIYTKEYFLAQNKIKLHTTHWPGS